MRCILVAALNPVAPMLIVEVRDPVPAWFVYVIVNVVLVAPIAV
jgi:hypothetical protein